MLFRHHGYNKKGISPLLILSILVIALLISGLFWYHGISKADATSLNTTPLNQETPEPLTQAVLAQPEQTVQESPLPFNQLVLAQIASYNSGSYPYLLNTDYAHYNGVTSNLYYQGKLLLRANPSGNHASHCVGITFEVYFRAMQEWNKQHGYSGDTIKGLSFDQLNDFILKWYVAGPKKDNNLVIALKKYKLGQQISNFEEARPGDFIDFSRENQTGHTVVLMNWIRDNGKIVGLRYWSSQESTNGIGYKTEYFNIPRSDGTKYGNIMRDTILIGRVIP